MAIRSFFHVALCVADMNRSLPFYRDVLGFQQCVELDFEGHEVSRVMGLDDCQFKGVFLRRDGMHLELISFHKPRPPARPEPRANQLGLSHFTFTVDDLDRTLADLKARGVPVLEHTRGEPAPGVPVCLIRDPDGNLIELYQHPEGVPSPYEVP